MSQKVTVHCIDATFLTSAIYRVLFVTNTIPLFNINSLGLSFIIIFVFIQGYFSCITSWIACTFFLLPGSCKAFAQPWMGTSTNLSALFRKYSYEDSLRWVSSPPSTHSFFYRFKSSKIFMFIIIVIIIITTTNSHHYIVHIRKKASPNPIYLSDFITLSLPPINTSVSSFLSLPALAPVTRIITWLTLRYSFCLSVFNCNLCMA